MRWELVTAPTAQREVAHSEEGGKPPSKKVALPEEEFEAITRAEEELA